MRDDVGLDQGCDSRDGESVWIRHFVAATAQTRPDFTCSQLAPHPLQRLASPIWLRLRSSVSRN